MAKSLTVAPEPFVEDDDGYLSWLREHPGGFVLNCARKPSAAYLPLHRASCRKISGEPDNGISWTTAYQKVCATTIGELEQWARAKTGAGPTRCGICRP